MLFEQIGITIKDDILCDLEANKMKVILKHDSINHIYWDN